MATTGAGGPDAAVTDAATVRRWRDLLASEREAATLCDRLAAGAGGERADILRELAGVERRHAAHWEERLRAAGQAVPPASGPGLRTRLLTTTARRGAGAAPPPADDDRPPGVARRRAALDRARREGRRRPVRRRPRRRRRHGGRRARARPRPRRDALRRGRPVEGPDRASRAVAPRRPVGGATRRDLRCE